MTPVVSLFPLGPGEHADALQAVYRATPHYWQLYHLPSSPAGQAARDLAAATETPGRSLLGIVRRVVADDAAAGVEMVGVVDFRLHWPSPAVVYVAMIMVAEPVQRQGIGTQAWRVLAPWLAQSAGMKTARIGVEQFNPGALEFFQHIGFTMTGESQRIQSGKRFVRLLYLELPLTAQA
jgi:GNAT superfamily N-acetyltransferase